MLKRIVLTFFGVSLLAVIIATAISGTLINTNYQRDLEKRLESNARIIAALMADHKKNALNDLLITLKSFSTERITVIDSTGIVLSDTELPFETLENHLDREEVIQAFDKGYGKSIRYSKSSKDELLYVAILSEVDGEACVVRLSVPINRLETFQREILKQLTIAIIVSLMISMIIGYRFSKKIISPLAELTLASRHISEGGIGQKVYISSNDEVGELAKTFNHMSQALYDNIANFNDRNMKLSAILNSMINAVIVVDNHRKILFSNPEAEKLFGFKGSDVEGHYFIEIIRHNILDEQIRNLIVDGKEVVTDIEIFEPHYHILKVYSNPIEMKLDDVQRYGVVMLFQDMTEMRKLERMRKDFVANVSHELKTPLTSIRGFVETLRAGASDNLAVRDRFLQIIEFETDRLTTIIEDLLKLSDIENYGLGMMTEKFDICQPTRDVIEFMRNTAMRHEVVLVEELPHNELFVLGKLNWFKQLIINLVDNAIKYNRQAGMVEVKLWEENGQVNITVKDTGLGIPEEHLDRLFERFYRVDKARSRDVGGTGLGLAIVKHIVIHFNGKISVKSKLGEGTQFTVELPLVTANQRTS